MEAIGHLVEVVELGHDTAGVTVGIIHVINGLNDLQDMDAHLFDTLLLGRFIANPQDLLLDGVEEVGGTFGPVVGLGDALSAILNDTA